MRRWMQTMEGGPVISVVLHATMLGALLAVAEFQGWISW